jgi:hypothetical protein
MRIQAAHIPDDDDVFVSHEEETLRRSHNMLRLAV